MMRQGHFLKLAAGLSAALLSHPAAAHSDREIDANPFQPRAEMADTRDNGAFTVVVAPSLADKAAAAAAARAESAKFCQRLGMSAPETFRRYRPHSTYVLDAWEFSGKCD